MPRQSASARDRTARHLTEAAWRVYRARGLPQTTVRAVAAEAGCAVGALYTYFPNKDALVRELAVRSLAEIPRRTAAGMEPGEALLEVYGMGGAGAPLLAALFTPAGQDREADRRATGRLLAALAPLAETYRQAGASGADAGVQALAEAAFHFGLALLEHSGQLDRLGVGRGEVAATFVRRWGGRG